MGVYNNDGSVKIGIVTIMIVGGALTAIIVLFGMIGGFKAFGRYQHRQDALNSVKISEIEIRNQAQRVEVAKQQAEIRLQNAVGVRESQDEIAKTLTPLYVQFEMVEALKEIAESGRNNTVVFVPAGANGIPQVFDVAGATKVGVPSNEGGE